MSEELKEKVARLPVWAREYVKRLQIEAEPSIEEITRLRRKVEQLERINRTLEDRISAMVEMFQYAATLLPPFAAEITKIVETWIISDEE